jgi:hypothetical protein
MIDRMDDVITTAFAPVIGLPCWGVDRVHGSILSFEFGSPDLVVREPIASTSPLEKVRQQMSQRRVKPVGEWNLLIFACHWRVVLSGETIAEDHDIQERIDAATRAVDGQKLTAFTLEAASRTTILKFDLGATMTIWPYAADDDEQWSLYQPDGNVLTYRADGRCGHGRGDEKPDDEIWRTVSQNLSLPRH